MVVEVKPREHSDVETEQLATGCEAIAEAIRLADVDVMAAYPIRPYDGVMQAAAKLIANGKMDVEYIVADGEHSQFEIVKHACAVGSRVFVGSSGVGWFYAFEAIAVTAGLRLPVVAICGNRALDDPGAFGTEHNDSLAVRDLGWLLPWAETAQEALDLALMAWRVGEVERLLRRLRPGEEPAEVPHRKRVVVLGPERARVVERAVAADRDHGESQARGDGDRLEGVEPAHPARAHEDAGAHGAGVLHDLELAVLAVGDDVFDVHLAVGDELRGGLHDAVVRTDRIG